MANKKRTNLPLANDVDNSFEDEDFILNYRPKIEFVEPAQEHYSTIVDEEPTTIDDIRDKTQELVTKFNAINKLCDLAQKRIDNRVNSSGGVTVNLNPKKDAVVIAAMKRAFPNKQDPTKITYDDYKKAIDCLNKSGPDIASVDPSEIAAAQSDPTRTNFGGYDNQHGENRAELSSVANALEPMDLDKFQKSAVLALFAMMLPLIKAEDHAEIIQHMIDTPHGF